MQCEVIEQILFNQQFARLEELIIMTQKRLLDEIMMLYKSYSIKAVRKLHVLNRKCGVIEQLLPSSNLLCKLEPAICNSRSRNLAIPPLIVYGGIYYEQGPYKTINFSTDFFNIFRMGSPTLFLLYLTTNRIIYKKKYLTFLFDNFMEFMICEIRFGQPWHKLFL